MTERDELQNAAGAYVLNALTGDEKREFERLMAGSEQLRSEVTELMDTAVELGLSVEPVDPGPALRSSILSAAATTPQAPAEAAEGTPSAPRASSTPPAPGPAELKARSRWGTSSGASRRGRRGRRPHRRPRIHGPHRHPGSERHRDGVADQRDSGVGRLPARVSADRRRRYRDARLVARSRTVGAHRRRSEGLAVWQHL